MAQGLASAMLGAFEEGYALPGRLRAKQAAVERYGERANDPGLFSALEGETRAQEQHQSTMATNQQNREIRSSQESRTAQTHSTQMEMTEEDRKKKAVLSMVNGLREARDAGKDVGEAFDNQMETLKVLGVSEEDVPAMRQAVLDDPTVLDQYHAALTGAKPAAKSGGSDRQQARAVMNDPNASEADKVWAAKVMGTKLGDENGDGAAEDVTAVISELEKYYKELDEGGGIVNPEEDVLSNTIRWMRGSWAGRAAGRTTGTENESFRRSIEAIRPHLLLAVKAAEELGARMFDSNKDMEMWLSTVTDPSQDYATVKRALEQFQRQYGKVMGEAQENAQTIAPGFVDPASGMTFKGGDPSSPDSWSK